MIPVFSRRRKVVSTSPSTLDAITGVRPKPISIVSSRRKALAGAVIMIGVLHRPAPVVAPPTKLPSAISIAYRIPNPKSRIRTRPIFIGKPGKSTPVVTGWRHIQDQIDAGYPIYIQPAADTASYVETFDFGVIYNNIIVNVNYDYSLITGTMTIGISTEVSTDGISWAAPSTSLSFFTSAIRYARVTVNFDGGDNKSLLEFFNFRVALNVRLENDGGQITANAGDASGTVVTFTKTFKRIVSITLTSKQLHPVTMIYDFSFPANPTTFKVLAYDISGNRITEDITWAARGVI